MLNIAGDWTVDMTDWHLDWRDKNLGNGLEAGLANGQEVWNSAADSLLRLIRWRIA